MNNDLISREALKKALELTDYNDIYDLTMTERLIDNAPTVDIPNCGGQVVPDMLQGWRYDEISQGDIRWTDKVFVKSNGDIIDFEGRVVGHINLEDMKGGAE